MKLIFTIVTLLVVNTALFSAHICQFPPKSINSIEYVNDVRYGIGLHPLLDNSYLQKAAQHHSDYQTLNGIGHYEQKGRPAFLGQRASDRVVALGYDLCSASENIAYARYEKEGVENLMTAIYHRLAFLDYKIDAIGKASSKLHNDKNSVYTYVMSNSLLSNECSRSTYANESPYYKKICKNPQQKMAKVTKDRIDKDLNRFSPKYVLYPYKNQREVPPAFFEETPDPLPAYSMVGNPISIEFHPKYAQQKIRVSSVTLVEVKNQENQPLLALHKDNDPQHKLSNTQFVFYPKKRLNFNSKYEATLSYKIEDESYIHTLKWQFATQILDNLLFIDKQTPSIRLKKNKLYTLYFIPSVNAAKKKASAKVEFAYSFFQGSEIVYEIVDSMTIQICLHGKKGDVFKVINTSSAALKELQITIE